MYNKYLNVKFQSMYHSDQTWKSLHFFAHDGQILTGEEDAPSIWSMVYSNKLFEDLKLITSGNYDFLKFL